MLTDRLPLLAALLLTLAMPAIPAQAQGPAPSPYRGQESRDIKALSPEDVKGLEQGMGMGLAKAAELNRYPGPAHVLQLAEPLALTPQQREAVQAVFARMQARAVELGRQILARERELDRAFAAGDIQPADLERRVAEIARLQGELRTDHLRAHLETLPLLSSHQVQQYVTLRGYGTPAGDQHHSMHGMHGMPQ